MLAFWLYLLNRILSVADMRLGKFEADPLDNRINLYCWLVLHTNIPEMIRMRRAIDALRIIRFYLPFSALDSINLIICRCLFLLSKTGEFGGGAGGLGGLFDSAMIYSVIPVARLMIRFLLFGAFCD